MGLFFVTTVVLRDELRDEGCFDGATRAHIAPTSVGSPQAATVRHDGSDDGRCVERGARQDAVVAQDVRGINAGFVAKRQDPLACEDPRRGQDPGAVRPREDPGG